MSKKIHIETDEPGLHAVSKDPGAEAPADSTAADPAAGAEQIADSAVAAEFGPNGIDPVDETAVLRARVAELEKQVEQEHNGYLRALADFQNFRRRSDEQRGELQQFANRELIIGLLPVLDNFERALSAAEKNQSYEALVGGVALTLRQLQDYLKKIGVEPIESVGEQFDPELHEAIGRVDDGDHPENSVVDEVQRGYKLHSRVLRPSMVRVARSE